MLFHSDVLAQNLIGTPAFGGSLSGTTTTISNFNIPAGDDRILIVYGVSPSGFQPTVAYDNGGGAVSLILFETNPAGSSPCGLYILAIGSGAAESGDITWNNNGSGVSFTAIAFEGVDQDTPIGDSDNFAGLATTSNLSLTAEVGDLLVDVTLSRGGVAGIGVGQSNLGSATISATNDGVTWSSKVAATTPETMTGTSTSGQIKNFAFVLNTPIPAEVPTLSEWGLLNLALLLMICGTLYLVQPMVGLEEKELVG